MAILRDIHKNVEQQEPITPKLTRQIWQEMTEHIPKSEDGTIIPPTKEEMAPLIAGSVVKTGMLDVNELKKLQKVLEMILKKQKGA